MPKMFVRMVSENREVTTRMPKMQKLEMETKKMKITISMRNNTDITINGCTLKSYREMMQDLNSKKPFLELTTQKREVALNKKEIMIVQLE